MRKCSQNCFLSINAVRSPLSCNSCLPKSATVNRIRAVVKCGCAKLRMLQRLKCEMGIKNADATDVWVKGGEADKN